MIINDEVRYRAVQSRDARFDGKFFTAVMTTGVYCRPICPAKTPLRRNVRFFSCAAAAEEAGFRPCKRCRPESAPGTPVWNGTESSVARGVRLIESGFLEERSVEELADVLGMGSRHLRRLFIRHLGAPPKALDLRRKTHFAALLLAQTALPVTSIALDSGFRSIRRFNDAFRQSFGLSPTEVRRRAAVAGPDGPRSVCTELLLSYRPPFDWQSLLDFYAKRAIHGVELVVEGRYRRSFSVATKNGPVTGTLSVANLAERNSLLLQISAAPVKLSKVTARIRSMFDLSADPQIIAEHLGKAPRLAPLVEQTPGVRIPGYFDPFEAAVRAVLGQQITVGAAVGLLDRLVRLCGTSLGNAATDFIEVLFPTPRQLYEADLSSLGMPGTRKRALKAVAGAWLDGSIGSHTYRGSADLLRALESIDGIGTWTAEYTSLRGFGEPDALPASDVGLRAAVGRLLGRQEKAATREVEQCAEEWRPWRGYAAQLLWQSLDGTTKEE